MLLKFTRIIIFLLTFLVLYVSINSSIYNIAQAKISSI